MAKQDKITIVQIVAWLLILLGVMFTAGQSFATLQTVKEAIAEIRPTVIKHGQDLSAIKAVLKLEE